MFLRTLIYPILEKQWEDTFKDLVFIHTSDTHRLNISGSCFRMMTLEISLTENNSQLFEIEQYILNLVKTADFETVEHLIVQVQQKSPLSKQEILDHIIALQNQGKLILKNSVASAPFSLKTYLLSKHGYWYWFTLILSVITFLLVFTISENTHPLMYVRYMLGAIFVLWLPGHALIKALFPTKEIDTIERIALSIGMSLALTPIIGLLLNYTPWGIRLTPVTLSLLALTITLATAALLREHQIKAKIR